MSLQDDSLVGVPSRLNRYKRAGKKSHDSTGDETNNTDVPEGDVDERAGEFGGGAGLTLIKIRLFKEVKKDEASND